MLSLRNDVKKGIKMKRSLIPIAVVLSIISLSLNGPPAYGGGRGHGGGGRVSSGFSGGRHFASMPARGGQMFTRSGMGTWRGQRWSGRNWNGGNWSGQRWSGRNWNGGSWSGQRWGGRNWNGSNWGGSWHHHNGNNIIFIGDFGFPWWWGWGWSYPYGYYDYSYPYDYYGSGYGYGNYGYDSGSSGYDYGYGYPSGGYGSYYDSTNYGNDYPNSAYYGGTNYGNGYPTHSRVAQLQSRLARAGYYSGAIDGILGSETRQAIRAFERDHAKSINDAAAD
jgi:hypothetical protein